MRRSELLGCRGKYADGTRILLPTSKNDEPKGVHLNALVHQVLVSIPAGEYEDRIFPDPTRGPVSTSRRCCRRSGESTQERRMRCWKG
jgi:hypothetical protein